MTRIWIIGLLYPGLVALAAAFVMPGALAPRDRTAVAMGLIADGRGAEAVHLLEDRVWRGVAEYRAERYRRAVVEFVQAEDVTALYNLGTAYARLAEWGGARAAYERVLSLDPAHSDAAHNLALVLQAEAQQQREEAAERNTRLLGEEAGADRGQDPDATGEKTTEEGAEPSADAAPTERQATRAGQVPAAGRTGDEPTVDVAAAGRGDDAAAEEHGSDGRAGAGALRLTHSSAQDAEILLRAIRDDPARVLRARLWAIDRHRREGAQ